MCLMCLKSIKLSCNRNEDTEFTLVAIRKHNSIVNFLSYVMFQTISSVVGHLDYSFASAWHPDGNIFATGNQDKTCRVWDLRNLSKPVAVLKGNMGAVRSVRFSSDGQFLVVAEPADFVHVYSARVDYQKRQEIDFFGEISGVSLSPDDESLFIGVWDRTYASLLQYNRINEFKYLDSYM